MINKYYMIKDTLYKNIYIYIYNHEYKLHVIIHVHTYIQVIVFIPTSNAYKYRPSLAKSECAKKWS